MNFPICCYRPQTTLNQTWKRWMINKQHKKVNNRTTTKSDFYLPLLLVAISSEIVHFPLRDLEMRFPLKSPKSWEHTLSKKTHLIMSRELVLSFEEFFFSQSPFHPFHLYQQIWSTYSWGISMIKSVANSGAGPLISLCDSS